jgi:hypothetical protein
MGSPTLQPLQDPILLLLWVCQNQAASQNSERTVSMCATEEYSACICIFFLLARSKKSTVDVVLFSSHPSIDVLFNSGMWKSSHSSKGKCAFFVSAYSSSSQSSSSAAPPPCELSGGGNQGCWEAVVLPVLNGTGAELRPALAGESVAV